MSEEASKGRRLLGQILKARKVLGEGQVQEALDTQREQGGLFGQCLVALGHATSADVAMALAEQAGLETVDLETTEPTAEALERVDASTAHTFGVLPLRLEGDTLVLAIGDPLNTAVLEDLSFSTGMPVRGVVGDATKLSEWVEELYGAEESLSDVIADAAASVTDHDAEAAAASQPVVRLLNSILHRAIRDRASDVHFETFEGAFRIRYRVDGALYEVESPPPHLALPLVSRVKVMSNLDITEVRVPQDGRIELSIDGRPVDLRVATLPSISGEGCVLRILDRSSVNLDLRALGLQQREEQILRDLVELPHGIVLITGPTGSGKTTTLYAMLQEANSPDLKVITTEDPVEYEIEGIVQVPVNHEIGVTYASVLRTILRQDPDKILVGEIRDEETASVAVEASLTGHTVFSTIHTNDAPSTITRLVDMGIQPFLISATLEAVVAQRLVRRICPNCREAYQPDEDLLRELGPDGAQFEGATLYYGKGCDECHHTGYRGRMGIFEVLRVDAGIKRSILSGGSSNELRDAARASGMRSLRESGLNAVLEGVTTIEEVLRETIV
ncbi:MAG: Flp pilus assembly complex ATPase component TadA [Planctomycetes bacterium]|nr:Flp pilus assembly complex ATPase component TadA [Planctomycetota bacterium]